VGELLCVAMFLSPELECTWHEATPMMNAPRRRVTHRSLLCTALLLIGPANADTPIDLVRYFGQVLYPDFWATWCVPCRQSFPWMQALKGAYQRQGLTVVAINLDHDRADGEQFLQRFHPDFAVQFNPQGTFAERFKGAGMPTSVIIDRRGVARFTHGRNTLWTCT
jgi:thiol-disulfide isomerase/thioredoxin